MQQPVLISPKDLPFDTPFRAYSAAKGANLETVVAAFCKLYGRPPEVVAQDGDLYFAGPCPAHSEETP